MKCVRRTLPTFPHLMLVGINRHDIQWRKKPRPLLMAVIYNGSVYKMHCNWVSILWSMSSAQELLLHWETVFCTCVYVQSPSQKSKRQQQELIAELKKKQVKDSRHVYEGKDGTIEDIITGNAHTAFFTNTFTGWAHTRIHTLLIFCPELGLAAVH